MKAVWLRRRLCFVIRQYPKRLRRLFLYYFHPFYVKPKWRAFPFILAECFLLFDLYEIISNLTKSSVRLLSEEEILRGESIFGKSIDLGVIMMDEKAQFLTRHLSVAYVGFNTINSWGKLRDDIFVHELVHIWQYQQFGAGYIANALVAQRSNAGYDYTQAVSYLPLSVAKHWAQCESIHCFTAEQQADLVQDYFRLKQGLKPEWETGFVQADLIKYQKFIDEIREAY